MATPLRNPDDLVRAHARLVRHVAHVYCRSQVDRDDLMQEILLQLWRSRHRYDGRAKESTWVYRVALNVAISFQRRARRHAAGRGSLEALADGLAAGPEPEADADQRALMEAIGGLGALDKALVLLHLDGLEHTAIGEVLGLSTSNVGTKLSRIRTKLRALLTRGQSEG